MGWSTAEELRHALRTVARRPWLSASVIAAVALGIGATTAIVSVVHGVLLRPLPFPDPDRIVWIYATNIKRAASLRGYANPLDVADWREQSRSFSAMSTFMATTSTLITSDGPTRVDVAYVTEGLPSVLGIRAQLGRLFENGDFGDDGSGVVLSDRLWRERFGAKPDIVGTSVVVSGKRLVVLGVLSAMPVEFPVGGLALWRPIPLVTKDNIGNRGGVWLRVVARMKPGVSIENARLDMQRIAANLAQKYPDTNVDRSVFIESLRDGIVGSARPIVLLLGGAVAIVLLIVCANIGNLLLVTAQDRQREFAIRLALGSSSGRIARMLLTESFLLTSIGALLGVAFAPIAIKALLALYPGGLPRASEVHVDGWVLAVAAALMITAALAAGIPPLRQANRVQVQRTLRASERGLGTRGERSFRASLLVGQIALSAALLIAGGLLLRTFFKLSQTRTGFTTEHMLTFNIALGETRYPDVARENAFDDALLDRIRALPGVVSAGATSILPLTGSEYIDGFTREGHADQAPQIPIARLHIISPGYVETIGLPLLRGRTITSENNRAGAAGTALVNTTFEHKYFPEGALGKRITFRGHVHEIVGIVADKHQQSLRDDPIPDLYMPRALVEDPRLHAWITVRAQSQPDALMPAIRQAIDQLDPSVSIADVADMSTRIDRTLAPDRFRTSLVGALALLALALAVLGIYALVAYTVSRQTREIGIRMALGEAPGETLARVLFSSLGLAALGIAIGTAIALAGARFIAAFVPEVGPHDPLTLTIVPMLFLAITALAAFGPAARASRVNPVEAMQSD